MSWPSRADRLSHSGPEYVWRQIADDITADIQSGALPSGAKLPSRTELASIYGVAGVTVTKAVKALRDEGLVRSSVGLGTYVK